MRCLILSRCLGGIFGNHNFFDHHLKNANMSAVNSVKLIGHLGKQPEVMGEVGRLYGYLTIATGRAVKQEDGTWKRETDWHYCEFGDRMAERLEKSGAGAGDLVTVEGMLGYKGEGKEKKIVIKLYEFEILKRSEKNVEGGESGEKRTKEEWVKKGEEAKGKAQAEVNEVNAAEDDDLPF